MTRHSTFAAGFPCLFAGPLVSRALGVRRFAALAGNLALLLAVHRGESAILFCHTDLLCPSFRTPTAMEVACSRVPYGRPAGLSRSRGVGCNGCATADQPG